MKWASTLSERIITFVTFDISLASLYPACTDAIKVTIKSE